MSRAHVVAEKNISNVVESKKDNLLFFLLSSNNYHDIINKRMMIMKLLTDTIERLTIIGRLL